MTHRKKESVIKHAPPGDAAPASDAWLTWFVAQQADEISSFGFNVKLRDQQLRQFLTNESYFLSALSTVIARNTGFSWTLQGPPRVVAKQQQVLQDANEGKGWDNWIAKVSFDLYTQDNGAFVEVERAGKGPDSPIIRLNHLDAARCWHRDDLEYPVLYADRDNVYHRLAWYQVCTLTEMPVPVEGRPGLQFCALSRMLRAAQIIRNITTYKEEKTGGRFNRAMHIIQGVTETRINDALAKMEAHVDSKGLLRYRQPLVIPVHDPKAKLDLKTLELAALPEGWDEEKTFKLYITIIAMAFLSDYQDFAPLPGGNLGTSAQSEVLHMKTRGKGPAVFRKLISHMLNQDILPKAVEFSFEEQDLAAEKEEADIQRVRAETRKLQIESGELTPQAGRQIAVDLGDIPQEVFEALGGIDVTPEVTAPDEEQVPEKAPPRTEAPIVVPEAEKEAPAKAGPFRRRMGGGLREDGEEGEEGPVDYW